MSTELNEAVDKLRIACREANFTGSAYRDDEVMNELAEFLLEHGAFEQYIDALVAYKPASYQQTFAFWDPSIAFSSAFVWSDTEEGAEFWLDLNTLWHNNRRYKREIQIAKETKGESNED